MMILPIHQFNLFAFPLLIRFPIEEEKVQDLHMAYRWPGQEENLLPWHSSLGLCIT